MLQKPIFLSIILFTILLISTTKADNLKTLEQVNQKQQNQIQDPFFELTQVKVKSDGESDGEAEESGEPFWNWVTNIFSSSEESSTDGEGGFFDNIPFLDGELDLFSLVQKKSILKNQASKILLQTDGKATDGESEEEEDDNDGGFIDWVLDIFSFGGDGESSSIIPDGEFLTDQLDYVPNPFDGELISLMQLKSKSDGEQDGEQLEFSESSDQEGFIDWIVDIFSFGGDGESSSFIPNVFDGELVGDALDVVPNPLDGELLSLIQLTNKSKSRRGADGESTSEESSEEGGFIDWIVDIFSFGDGELIPSMPDGEFLDVVPNPLDVVDGELISLIQKNKTAKSFVQVQKKQSKCTEPVSQKWGKQVWNEDWSGEWKFNSKGNIYGVEYNGEFLSLAKFDSKGKATLLFQNSNECSLQLSDFLQKQSVQSMKYKQGRMFIKTRQVDGEMITDVVPDFDGEQYLDYVNIDGEWVAIDSWDGEMFDFLPNPFDGEMFDFMPNPFDGEFFDFVPNPFDGEFFDFVPNPFDGEFFDFVPNPFDGEFFDFVPNPLDGELLPDGEFLPIDQVPNVNPFDSDEE